MKENTPHCERKRWESDEFSADDIWPYLRKPQNSTREASVWMIHSIDAKLEKLAKLGLAGLVRAK